MSPSLEHTLRTLYAIGFTSLPELSCYGPHLTTPNPNPNPTPFSIDAVPTHPNPYVRIDISTSIPEFTALAPDLHAFSAAMQAADHIHTINLAFQELPPHIVFHTFYTGRHCWNLTLFDLHPDSIRYLAHTPQHKTTVALPHAIHTTPLNRHYMPTFRHAVAALEATHFNHHQLTSSTIAPMMPPDASTTQNDDTTDPFESPLPPNNTFESVQQAYYLECFEHAHGHKLPLPQDVRHKIYQAVLEQPI